ncbi:MAG: hypothetical protein K2N07_11525 [Desulfovibrio sp.]|nr:hypothetical protein [Desulfovibrio sp.]
MKKVLCALCAALCVALSPGNALAEDAILKPLVTRLAKAPKSVLLVGNSFMYYNNGVGAYARQISGDQHEPMSFTMATIGGAGLDWHLVKSYLRPNGLRSYSTTSDGSNRLIFHEYPDGKIFDAVILQDNSQGPIHPELSKLFRKYAAIHCKDIREVGSEPLIMMTWAYADKPEMTAQLANATIEVANENRAMVVPVGLAFANAQKGRPDLRLIVADNRHPTPAGTYLEGCVIFATLSGKSPVGSKCTGVGDARISEADARYLQEVAWQTVKDFFGWNE